MPLINYRMRTAPTELFVIWRYYRMIAGDLNQSILRNVATVSMVQALHLDREFDS
jgi:hypothetical protein